MTKKGYVYLLGDTEKPEIYKIGVTKGAIEKRIKSLQTGNSGEIYMCKYFETNYPFFLEKHLHLKFGNKNIRNEWFELTNDEALNFKSYCEDIENMIISLKNNPFFGKNLK